MKTSNRKRAPAWPRVETPPGAPRGGWSGGTLPPADYRLPGWALLGGLLVTALVCWAIWS